MMPAGGIVNGGDDLAVGDDRRTGRAAADVHDRSAIEPGQTRKATRLVRRAHKAQVGGVQNVCGKPRIRSGRIGSGRLGDLPAKAFLRHAHEPLHDGDRAVIVHDHAVAYDGGPLKERRHGHPVVIHRHDHHVGRAEVDADMNGPFHLNRRGVVANLRGHFQPLHHFIPCNLLHRAPAVVKWKNNAALSGGASFQKESRS